MFRTSSLISCIAIAALPLVARADYTVDCEGFIGETGSYVEGECSDGDFEGYDYQTGHYFYGDCEFGGDFEAHDPETDLWVYGECEGE